MTALVGRDVKRTISGGGRDFAGLPGQSTLEAGSKDFPNCGDQFFTA
jgi:hypothetical protein